MIEFLKKIVIRLFVGRYYMFFIFRIWEIVKFCGSYVIKKIFSFVKLEKESKYNGLINCDILFDNMYIFFY